ncbi:DNA replication and repair protein RecF [Metalysinibacillus saudimassiliensis]|uniref:DNA replication and repair protein RecF n=1 Tax=Metalysinibacillus saudimassiliensis TaxID=1461583 RepID=A0A078MFR5_9BACL|nr:DNA replication and repair protein RecF [Metalysinibacillus saudimassiliensis]
MSIKSAHIQNFTVFENLEVEFSKGINVVIGTNGTGKTHILKAMYGICEGINNSNEVYDLSQLYFSVNPVELIRTRENPSIKTFIKLKFEKDNDATFNIIMHEGKKLAADGVSYNLTDFKTKSIFIPAKEMLSHSKGFLALYNKYKIPFDKTYIDIIVNAELPEARETSDLNNTLLATISNVIGGKVLHENGTFYIVKNNGNKIEFPIEAEGLRKFGLLWKLIKNGLLEEGTVLFWDEPEANINPELMPILVELMLELERKGVQLFIATHSYNLAKYLEIKRTSTEQVLFHHLHQTEQGVKVESDHYFGQLDDNPIIEADAKLLDEVIEGNFDD